MPAKGKEAQATQQEAKEAILQNDDIQKVEITTRSEHDAKQQDAASTDEKIHQQLGELANELIADQDKAGQDEDSNQAASDEKSKPDSNKKDQKTSSNDKAALGNKVKSASVTRNAEQSEPAVHNDDIEKVEVIKREADTTPEDSATQDAQIHQQLDALADEMISHDDATDTVDGSADQGAATAGNKSSDSKKPTASSANKAKSPASTNAKGKK